MKKFFTFIAAVVASLGINAQTISFAALTADDVTINETEWTWNEAKTELSLAAGVENVLHPITVKGIGFATKRSSGDRFFRLQEAGLYANGTNVNITIKGLKKGQEVTLNARSSKNAGGAAVNFTSDGTADAANPTDGTVEEFVNFKFVAAGAELVVKNSGAGFIMAAITIGNAPASSEVTEVDKTTLWTLTGAEDGTKLCTENVVNYQNSGLFLRSNNADGSHSVSAVAEAVEGKFSDGTAYSTTLTFNCPGAGLGESGTKGKDANASAAAGNDRCVAFKAAADGTLYVAMRTTSYKTDRELYIWSSEGVKVASLASNDASLVTVNAGAGEDGSDTYTYHFAELKTEVKSGLSYFIGGSNQNHIAAILFKVGDNTPSGIATIRTTTDGRWYNLQGQVVEAPTKGIFVKNGKKYLMK